MMTPEQVRRNRYKWFDYVKRRFDLVPLEVVADWCARERGSVKRDEEMRKQACRDLEYYVQLGEFGSPQKPHFFSSEATSNGSDWQIAAEVLDLAFPGIWEFRWQHGPVSVGAPGFVRPMARIEAISPADMG
jgi:hypothetical protein